MNKLNVTKLTEEKAIALFKSIGGYFHAELARALTVIGFCDAISQIKSNGRRRFKDFPYMIGKNYYKVSFFFNEGLKDQEILVMHSPSGRIIIATRSVAIMNLIDSI